MRLSRLVAAYDVTTIIQCREDRAYIGNVSDLAGTGFLIKTRIHHINPHEPRFWRTGPETRREPRRMPVVIGKARNDVFRACAPKPVREATPRVYCRVTHRSCGTTTPRSSCLTAHLAESASRPCGFMRRQWYETDGDIDPVRDHPRFKALMERF